MLKEFKAFILRGSVVDLAVGIVIGSAFTLVVNALVTGVLNQLIAAIFGKPSFGGLAFDINGTPINYGLFVNAVISFLLVAAALFFFVVKPVNVLTARRRRSRTPRSVPSASA
jgi:large conductance mechanosensitive channel